MEVALFGRSELEGPTTFSVIPYELLNDAERNALKSAKSRTIVFGGSDFLDVQCLTMDVSAAAMGLPAHTERTRRFRGHARNVKISDLDGLKIMGSVSIALLRHSSSSAKSNSSS